MSQPFIPAIEGSAVVHNVLLREEPGKVIAKPDEAVVAEMSPEQAEAYKKDMEAARKAAQEKEDALKEYAGRVIFKLLEPHLGHTLSVGYQLHTEDIPNDDAHYRRRLDSITLYCKTCKHDIVVVGPKANNTPWYA